MDNTALGSSMRDKLSLETLDYSLRFGDNVDDSIWLLLAWNLNSSTLATLVNGIEVVPFRAGTIQLRACNQSLLARVLNRHKCVIRLGTALSRLVHRHITLTSNTFLV